MIEKCLKGVTFYLKGTVRSKKLRSEIDAVNERMEAAA